jgi:prolyl-tRNA editing enzyme YbaK/EbsC (Cys-tRNA(Pro) deacylase)
VASRVSYAQRMPDAAAAMPDPADTASGPAQAPPIPAEPIPAGTASPAVSPAVTVENDSLLDHPAVARVRAALTANGFTPQIVVLDEHARTAADAARQLGVDVAQIANSLVFAVPDGVPDDGASAGRRAILVMTSGAHRVDTVQVAATLGVERLERADPDLVRHATGFAIGGVAPVGHPAPLQTLVDVTLAHYESVWAAAGHPRTIFRTTYDHLLLLTGGQAAEVA